MSATESTTNLLLQLPDAVMRKVWAFVFQEALFEIALNNHELIEDLNYPYLKTYFEGTAVPPSSGRRRRERVVRLAIYMQHLKRFAYFNLETLQPYIVDFDREVTPNMLHDNVINFVDLRMEAISHPEIHEDDMDKVKTVFYRPVIIEDNVNFNVTDAGFCMDMTYVPRDPEGYAMGCLAFTMMVTSLRRILFYPSSIHTDIVKVFSYFFVHEVLYPIRHKMRRINRANPDTVGLIVV